MNRRAVLSALGLAFALSACAPLADNGQLEDSPQGKAELPAGGQLPKPVLKALDAFPMHKRLAARSSSEGLWLRIDSEGTFSGQLGLEALGTAEVKVYLQKYSASGEPAYAETPAWSRNAGEITTVSAGEVVSLTIRNAGKSSELRQDIAAYRAAIAAGATPSTALSSAMLGRWAVVVHSGGDAPAHSGVIGICGVDGKC
ncbi:MAG: hypothetical protein H6707_18950 [Deltaproteobacteria bacterium]|nr:hypothetical protein [Deltaproteobacteria bacterium]